MKVKNSERAGKGKLSIIKGLCPYCGHKKLLLNQSTTKCSRCKQIIIKDGVKK